MAVIDGSLAMTVLNEAASIDQFLQTLSAQHSIPAEIVIVDGGSSDETVAILRSWRPPGGVRVVVIEVPDATISRGRNVAIQNALHEHIFVTDAGTTLSPTWVDALDHALRSGADVASGFFYPAGTTALGRIIARIITPLLTEIDGHRFLPSSRSIAFRRNAWVDAGGYPEWLDYCEDLVFDLRLKELGKNFEFVPDAWVEWDARPDLRTYAKQYYRYARGDGKARLWTRRHLARYGAYAIGFALIGTQSLWGVSIAALGAAAYMVKFGRRAIANEHGRRDHSRWTAIALVPVVVIVGDAAKMVGYPVGRLWRWRNLRREANGGIA